MLQEDTLNPDLAGLVWAHVRPLFPRDLVAAVTSCNKICSQAPVNWQDWGLEVALVDGEPQATWTREGLPCPPDGSW
jgi:hypothetical protein